MEPKLKTIEQLAEEYGSEAFLEIEKLEKNTGVSARADELMCLILTGAYLAGAAKQRELDAQEIEEA